MTLGHVLPSLSPPSCPAAFSAHHSVPRTWHWRKKEKLSHPCPSTQGDSTHGYPESECWLVGGGSESPLPGKRPAGMVGRAWAGAGAAIRQVWSPEDPAGPGHACIQA